MKCPRCENSVLDERERDGVTVDICRECRGVWLDRSELERIIARAVKEQAEYEQPAQPPAAPAQPPAPAPAQPPQGYAPPPQGYAPPPQGYPPAPPPQGYAPPPYPHRYRDDDTPPRGFRRDDHYEYSRDGRRYKKKHWFDSLSDIFD